MNVDYNKNDKEIYEKEFRNWLPEKIFDAHIHLFDESCLLPEYVLPEKSCYRKFGGTFTLEKFFKYTTEMLPEQEIFLNSFGHPDLKADREAAVLYTGKISDNKKQFGMTLVSPHDNIKDVKRRIEVNNLAGYKPYLNFVDWKDTGDITINDMLPREQMEYADEKGLIITLHIPRPGRLADPVNQKQMIEICRNYPNTKIIFAHIGRAYYLENIIGHLDDIAKLPNAFVDTAMVNHEGILEYTFNKFPRERILFGSDAPIALLRGKSVEINNQYAYLMAEDYRIGTAIYDSENKVQFTSFYYEQLRGIKLAATRAKLSQTEIENVLFNNAYNLFTNRIIS